MAAVHSWFDRVGLLIGIELDRCWRGSIEGMNFWSKRVQVIVGDWAADLVHVYQSQVNAFLSDVWVRVLVNPVDDVLFLHFLEFLLFKYFENSPQPGQPVMFDQKTHNNAIDDHQQVDRQSSPSARPEALDCIKQVRYDSSKENSRESEFVELAASFNIPSMNIGYLYSV